MEKSRVKPSIHLALILGITGSCFAMASSPVAQLQDPESTQYFNHAPCLVPNKGDGGREGEDFVRRRTEKLVTVQKTSCHGTM